MASEDYDHRFNPAYQRGHEDDYVTAPQQQAAEPAARRLEEPTVLLSETAAREQSSLRGNPWVAVLWVLAIALIAAGVAAQWFAQAMLTNARTVSAQTLYVVPAVLAELSPWLVAVGLVSLVAVVMLHAVRWRAP